MSKYKNPFSVLVVVYAKNTKRILMLQRQDDPDFWQSITGTIESTETPQATAQREIWEEIGVDILQENLPLFDCQKKVCFEIFAQFRYKYAPEVTHCLEHWFLLPLPCERAPQLTEHLNYQWLTPREAMALTKSWNNRAAIEQYLLNTENNVDPNL